MRLTFCLMTCCLFQSVWAIPPEEALERLMQGSQRYANDQMTCPNQSAMRRAAVLSKQKPFAVIVGCSDSRVPPEIVFDQGIGDLFVVRVAGNVIGPLELDSIEYAVLYLEASVIVVLGHEHCGAISAVADGNTKDIEDIAMLIEPAVIEARRREGNLVFNATRINVQRMVDYLQKTPAIAMLIEKKKLAVVGAYHSLTSGLTPLVPLPEEKNDR